MDKKDLTFGEEAKKRQLDFQVCAECGHFRYQHEFPIDNKCDGCGCEKFIKSEDGVKILLPYE